MIVNNTQRGFLVDPEIQQWCSQIRLQKLRSELGPAVRTLLWTKKLHSVVTSWVRRELISDFLESGEFGSQSDRNQKLLLASDQWQSLNGENTSPPCDKIDYENWYFAEEVLVAWSRQQWEQRLESLYLSKKQGLDFVSCSLLRVKDQSLAFELSLRLKANEASFEQLSWKYGEGPERSQGGRFEHQRLECLPNALRPLLAKLKPGGVLKPHSLGDWFVIVALDELVPAQFDDTTKLYLLSCELQAWLQKLSLYLVHHLELSDP